MRGLELVLHFQQTKKIPKLTPPKPKREKVSIYEQMLTSLTILDFYINWFKTI